jgi:prepilin-type N-terminal cleavage/methylation domain-containing protein/prepilin-type processing-associated H-X9-DG protein
MKEGVRKSKDAGCRGFTLVECLVVVALIAGLAVIAVIGSTSVSQASRQAKCAGNLRNLGLALHVYAQDHEGKFPETSHTRDLESSWIYQLEAYLGNFDESRICPADPMGEERLKARGTSYILNSYLFVPEVGPFGELEGEALNRLSAIPEPAVTLMAFICSDRVGTGPGNDHTHSSEWRSWTAVCRDIAPARFGSGDRNATRGRANYLFVDGRVESIQAGWVKQQTEAGINIAKPPGVEGLP